MRIWMPAVAAAVLAVCAPAHADVVYFDGAEVKLATPALYCTVGESQFSVLGTLFLSDDPGDVLTIFARCEEIDEVAAGSADTFRHYGLILGLRSQGDEAIRPGKPLEDYLVDFDVELSEAQNDGSRASDVGMNGNLAALIEAVGLVNKTDQAHFGAMTIRAREGGHPAMVAVVGRTLIDGRVVQVELYAPEDEAPIPELIVLGQETVAALWEANEATAGSSTVTADADTLEESGEMEEHAAEDDPLAAGDAPSMEEELAQAVDAFSALAGDTLQIVYWLLVGYLSASIALGVGIFGWFKLRPKVA